MFDKLIDQHKRPVCFWFHLVGFIALIYGLWAHSWTWIIIGIVLCLLGHLFTSSGSEKKKEESVSSEKPSENEPVEEEKPSENEMTSQLNEPSNEPNEPPQQPGGEV